MLAEAAVQHKVLLEHVRRLRDYKELQYAKLVFGFECNLGFEAQHAIHTLQRNHVKDWLALSEGPNGTPGILTTNSSKEIMNTALNELLVSNRLVIWEKLVCVSMDTKQIVKDLAAEMRGYMIHVDEPKGLFGKSRRTFSGKSGGETDDLCIALQLTVLGMQIFNRDTKYARHHS